MKNAWIIKTAFTPLFVSDCELNRDYIKKKWTSINDLAQPINISKSERTALVKTVIGYLNAAYPDLKRLYNRDGRTLCVQYLEKTALEGCLPSLSPSTNEMVNFMILTIFQEVYSDKKKWMSALYNLTVLFKDCQQVQYRAITEAYKNMKNMGSVETRISAIVDSWKYNWFRKLFEQHVGAHGDPHAESYYLAELGDELGLVETEAAKNDKLAPRGAQDVNRLRDILWDQVVCVQDIFDDIHNCFHGNGMTEEERVLCSAELRHFLEERDMYAPQFYEEDSGYVTYDTTVKILLLVEVISHPDISNEVWVNQQSSAKNDVAPVSSSYQYTTNEDEEQDFQYSDDGEEMDQDEEQEEQED